MSLRVLTVAVAALALTGPLQTLYNQQRSRCTVAASRGKALAAQSPTQMSRRSDAVASEPPGPPTDGGHLPKVIGAMFRAAREAQRLSQDELADLTYGAAGGRVSRTTISSIERGRSLPGLDTLLSLTRVLHLEPVEVLERVGLATVAPVDLTGLSLEELNGRAKELFIAGEHRKALALFDAAFERLILDPPEDVPTRQRLQAGIEVNRAVALRRCSALKAAHASAERAVELSDGLPELQATAYTVLASLLSHEGHLVLARDMSDRAVGLAPSGNARLRTDVLTESGLVPFETGTWTSGGSAPWVAPSWVGIEDVRKTIEAQILVP